jgi:hypothetical protein
MSFRELYLKISKMYPDLRINKIELEIDVRHDDYIDLLLK